MRFLCKFVIKLWLPLVDHCPFEAAGSVWGPRNPAKDLWWGKTQTTSQTQTAKPRSSFTWTCACPLCWLLCCPCECPAGNYMGNKRNWQTEEDAYLNKYEKYETVHLAACSLVSLAFLPSSEENAHAQCSTIGSLQTLPGA